MKGKLEARFLHETIDMLTTTKKKVSRRELREIINCFVQLDILSEHGSFEKYEEYINKTYGDILVPRKGKCK